jgi:hypothetical protein
MEVTLSLEQWDAPAPECPQCAARTNQDFKPFAIGGSHRAKAVALAEDIAANDYHVADMQSDGREGGKPKVRYKDITPSDLPGAPAAELQSAINRIRRDGPALATPAPPSQWGGVSSEALATAVALGRETRLKHGNGLDILQHNLKTGVQPDLIEVSKRRSARVW